MIFNLIYRSLRQHALSTLVTAGGIVGRNQMVTALTGAHITAGDKLRTAMRGIQAYRDAMRTIGDESEKTLEVTVGLLGSALRAAGRADEATPGGI